MPTAQNSFSALKLVFFTFQRHFIASAPSMTASEEPAHAVPGASGSPSP